MREWQLKAGDPLAMRFAADVRLGRTDYADDQSWEVMFGTADEPALSVQTRYAARFRPQLRADHSTPCAHVERRFRAVGDGVARRRWPLAHDQSIQPTADDLA